MASGWDSVTVVGTGGIGGTVAGELALAGERVTAVERAEAHIAAMRGEGLLLDGVRGEHRVRFERVLFPEELDGSLGLVILAVKSHHTADALRTIAPLLADDGVVVSLQNGLNERRIAEAVGVRRTLGGMVHLVADYAGPGHVTRFAEGEFRLGELDGALTDRVAAAADCLGQVAPTHTTTNIWGYLWAKQVYSCYLVATALVDAPSSEMLKPEWTKRVFVAIMGEATEVALAEGVALEEYARLDPRIMLVRTADELPRALAALPTGSAKGNSGIWRDIHVRHRPSETEFLTGDVVRIGRQHGLPMPLNGRVAEMVQEIEAGRRRASWDNLRALEPLANARLPGGAATSLAP
jgi:2-dehydropantoate 2-reductase